MSDDKHATGRPGHLSDYDNKHVVGHVGYSPDYGSRKPESGRPLSKPRPPAHFLTCVEICEGEAGTQVKAAVLVTCPWCRGWMTGRNIKIPVPDKRQRQIWAL